MAKKTVEHTLPPGTKIEVVMRKEMTLEAYLRLIPTAKKKNWLIQGYQIGYNK